MCRVTGMDDRLLLKCRNLVWHYLFIRVFLLLRTFDAQARFARLASRVLLGNPEYTILSHQLYCEQYIACLHNFSLYRLSAQLSAFI